MWKLDIDYYTVITWEGKAGRIIEKYGLGERNIKGSRLLELCEQLYLTTAIVT